MDDTPFFVGKKVFLLVLRPFAGLMFIITVGPSSHAVSIYHSAFSFSAVFSPTPGVGLGPL